MKMKHYTVIAVYADASSETSIDLVEAESAVAARERAEECSPDPIKVVAVIAGYHDNLI